MMYEYAHWGAIEKLKTITQLYNMCIEAGDGDAAEEYKIEIEKIKSDFDIIVRALGYDKEASWQVLDYEIRKVCEA